MGNCFVKIRAVALPVIVWSQAVLVWAQTETVVVKEENTVDNVKKILDWIVEATVKYSFQVLGGIIILVCGWFLAKFLTNFLSRFLGKHNVDITVAKFIVGAAKMVVMAFAALIALGKFGIEIAPFIAGLSVVGFATSFALQGPLSNYAAGATLIFTKPFKVGDIIEVVNEMGEVQDMSLPRTILKTVDGTMVVIPNKHIIGEIIHNFSDLKRIDIKVGVAYQADIDKAIQLILGVIQAEPRIFKNQDVKVGIFEFGDSSVNLYARIWCKQVDYWDVMFTVNRSIFGEFNRNGIVIPFPQRDVHLYQAEK